MSEKISATENEPELEVLEDRDEEERRYEPGFHLIPSLSEEEVLAVVAAFKTTIEAGAGTIIDEGAPEKITLAYSIQKDIDRKRHTYTESYFGWIRFTALPSFALSFKEGLEENGSVLRFLVVKVGEKEEAPEEAEEEAQASSTETEEESSKEEIDQEIDKLVEEGETA